MSYWIEQPKDLFKFKFSNTYELANSLSLIVIILTILISLALQSIKPFYVGVVILAIVGIIYYLLYNPEPFEQTQNVHMSPHLRQPTANNPFMNVPIRDYDEQQHYDNYDRYNTKVYPTPKNTNK